MKKFFQTMKAKTKKFFAVCALALILAVAGGYGVKASMNSSNNTGFSALVLANAEALAGDEWGDDDLYAWAGFRSCVGNPRTWGEVKQRMMLCTSPIVFVGNNMFASDTCSNLYAHYPSTLDTGCRRVQ